MAVISVDITVIEGRIPLSAAAGNDQLEANRQLLRDGRIVHIARQRDVTALLAAADSGRVDCFRQFLKHRASVVTAIKNIQNI
jgi:ankyrin repeat protein